jgi:serine protease Do
LAVIKINAKGLTAARLGSSTELQIGQWVVAAGNPFGLDNTITAGIVSAKGRSIMGGNQYEDFIQTDAAINPGNSGGPLVNLSGEVIGINTAIFSRSGGYMGIGFAIPIDMAKRVMESLISTGKVVRGWLGVGIQNLTEDMAQSFDFAGTNGALVGDVQADSPAQRAGLQQGDIITQLGSQKIENSNQLRNIVADIAPGKTVKVHVFRNGQERVLDLTVGEQPAQGAGDEEAAAEEESPADSLGLELQSLNAELAKRLGTKKSQGVVITNIRPDGLAANSGLLPGDIVLSVNGKKVSSVAEFRKAVDKAALGKGIRMVVETQGMERFVFLKGTVE